MAYLTLAKATVCGKEGILVCEHQPAGGGSFHCIKQEIMLFDEDGIIHYNTKEDRHTEDGHVVYHDWQLRRDIITQAHVPNTADKMEGPFEP